MEKLELKPEREYERIHAWIHRNYGKALICESKECKNISKRFQWALKKGCKYERNRGSFIQLCPSCHKKYDFTEEVRKNLSNAKKGSKHSQAKLSENQVIEIRKNYKEEVNYCLITSLKYNVSWHTINYILKRKTWKHI